MSTADDHNKKRKVHRACDHCKRKKSEGPQSFGMKCSQCINDGSECTYHEAAKKRGSAKLYITNLENRLKRAEALLAKLCPDTDFSQALDGTVEIESLAWNGKLAGYPRPSTKKPSVASISLASSRAPYDGASGLTIDEKGLDSSDDEQPQMMDATLSERLERLEIDPSFPLFMGKSSGMRLVYSAFALKNELSGKQHDHHKVISNRRPEFWNISPWEESDINYHENVARNVAYQLPDADLIPQLVDKYFSRVNVFSPLLHRPTFEHQVAEQLFLSDTGFAAVLLLVCAIGARYVDDQRVRLDGETSASAGWRWFNQVQMVRKSLWATPRLVDIQVLVLAVIFLSGSSSPQACWKLTSTGIRYIQDVGAHRRKVYASKPTPNEEMWKRAFWVLITTDRMASYILGRPPAIQDEDFDVDLPADCDDEYWTPAIPEEAFKQPSNKPSQMACFLHLLRLYHILTFTIRTVYSINKSKTSLGFVGQEWEQRIVAELDSALNKWTDEIPDHLRWDPTREDNVFFDQSALLYSHYYFVQIVVHRPFISTPGKQSPLSFSSLAICTNAARACSHILDAQQQRTDAPQPYQMLPALTAAIVLLINIWGGKRSNLTVDNVKQMSDVDKCMNVLKTCETYWHAAGRGWDILCELASVGDLPLLQGIPRAVYKRERNSDEPAHSDVSESCKSGLPAQRNIVGLRRTEGKGTPPSGVIGLVDAFHFPSPRGSVPLRAQTEDITPTVQSSHVPVPPPSGSNRRSPPSELTPSALQMQMLPLLSCMSNSYVSGPSAGPSNVDGDPLAYVGAEQNLWEVDPMYNHLMGSPFQASSYQPGQEIFNTPSMPLSGVDDQALLNSDTLSMWMNAPSGFELDEWGSYLAGFGDLSEQQTDPAIMFP